MTNVIIFSSDKDDQKKLMSGTGGSKAASVPLADLEANIAAIGPAIAGVIGKLKETAKEHGLSEVTLAIGVNGKGAVGFLGTGAEVGAEASISLKFDV